MRPPSLSGCCDYALLQAVAAANAALAAGTFRRVIGKSVATTIQPAEDYYLAEVGWGWLAGCGEERKGERRGKETYALLVGCCAGRWMHRLLCVL